MSLAQGTGSSLDLHWLIDEIGNGGVAVLCGAGLSTDSGIPDYRGPNARPRRQITLQEFSRSEQFRQRYWARSYVGFEKFEVAGPNAGHHALAALQSRGYVGGIITQNVDGLQQEAGSVGVIDLHGRIDEVICLDCRQVTARQQLQDRLRVANAGFLERHDGVIAPDGDADIADTAGFHVVPCLNCGGRLKPHVVMFGETVLPEIVEACYAVVDAAEMLLVVGSSLQVQSGLRFVRRAHGHKPVAIVNRGRTRGDAMADVHLEHGVSETLTAIADALD
ncbi:Sir2 family NAD-dependent protein deacetylase [Cumulibacter manganitolerans]|uniref:Sir2 family NAD-dependent protein deacetylase n=1 Tax=Cumulibacter manganitolerans TaxID=1884992 RepID=UPI001E285A5A|nr:Sir2 family NAD-dependent protein deacetylase [Cumulibacter manganitolerans]